MISRLANVRRAPVGLTRRFGLWFFRTPPFSPYVTFNVAVGIDSALTYLSSLRARDVKVGLNHLVVAAIARLYREFPAANACARGRNIFRYKHVGVAMPVDMLDDSSSGMETAIVLLEQIDQMTLPQLAEATRRQAQSERSGKRAHPLIAALANVGDRVPGVVAESVLRGLDLGSRSPILGSLFRAALPISVVVSNPGSRFSLPEDVQQSGIQQLGAAFSPPDRIVSVGSLVGLGPIEERVFAKDGAPFVAQALPVTYIFDHRLFDGVLAARLMGRLGEILTRPAQYFGEDGEKQIWPN